MSGKRINLSAKSSVSARAQSWIVQGDAPAATAPLRGALYTARLTIDITPALRARIKVSAFERGVTVVELLRDLLEREFPDESVARR